MAEYCDLAEVFSEIESDVLPPHRPTDYAVEVILGAKLPKPKMYLMTPKEIDAFQAFINKNLEWGSFSQ